MSGKEKLMRVRFTLEAERARPHPRDKPIEPSCRKQGDSCVELRFLRKELLYDIKNYAYVEADLMEETAVHAQHMTADIGTQGNVDRVNRVLAMAHEEVKEMLYPYTKEAVEEETVDDKLYTPTEYVIVLNLPWDMSKTTVMLLSRQIHEYMVTRVLADWLSITDKVASADWQAKCEETKAQIEMAMNRRRYALTRKMSVF